jgi:hypothetical protein
MPHRSTWFLLFWTTLGTAAPTLAAEPSVAEADYFERHIRPTLVENCYQCHSALADELKAGLRLDTDTGRRRGGDSGPAVVPGDAEASLLLRAIRYDEDVSPMPPDRQLPAEVVQSFQQWIQQGAVAPNDGEVSAQSHRAPSQESAIHWAFQRPRSASFAPASPADGGSNRIDRILAKYRAVVPMLPSEPASKSVLIRRLYYDLVGLPPRFEDVQTFTAADTPQAVEQLVERLLASPRFGERWARYWLDVARFSDTKGYVFTADRNYPDAYKYRDWVIQSLNQDRPLDDFIRYQLAADHLAGDDPQQLAAMGFLTLGRRFLNNTHDIIDDRIDVTTRGLMGLTVSCARCHDHKYDPIPTEDYYSLYGVFASSREPGGEPSPLRLEDAETPTAPVVFLRGQPGQRGAQVPRQFLEVLTGPDRQPFQKGSGRLELAEAIASVNNPLTARVFVNRVWGHLFGSYLVDTPSDFGTRSSQPALAELLDDLAVELMRHEWSVKWLVREIVLSSTYGQSSASRNDVAQQDATNQLYWRVNRRRLDFEAMRDSLLYVSGQLKDQPIGGPSVEISNDQPDLRRSLYAHIDRQNFPGLFRIFDVASPDTHAPKRFETTVPQQALYLINSPFALNCAQRLAEATNHLASDPQARVQALYRRVLSRLPDDWELQRALAYLAAAASASQAQDTWVQLSQILLVSNEFFFLD